MYSFNLTFGSKDVKSLYMRFQAVFLKSHRTMAVVKCEVVRLLPISEVVALGPGSGGKLSGVFFHCVYYNIENRQLGIYSRLR